MKQRKIRCSFRGRGGRSGAGDHLVLDPAQLRLGGVGQAEVQFLGDLAGKRVEDVLAGLDVAAGRGVVAAGRAVAADEGDVFPAEDEGVAADLPAS
jgi:hypothetical protein